MKPIRVHSCSSLVKATQHGKHVVHAANANGNAVCGGGNGAKKSNWQEDLGEPTCERCLLILATRTILPCPFCGGKTKFRFCPASLPECPAPFYTLGCDPTNQCTVWPETSADTKLAAIHNWNTRKGAKR